MKILTLTSHSLRPPEHVVVLHAATENNTTFRVQIDIKLLLGSPNPNLLLTP